MNNIARIDDEYVSTDDFIKILKFKDRLEDLLEDVLGDRLMVLEAKRQGLQVTPEELQERADNLRRVEGLHRAKDMFDYLNAMGVTLDDFEQYLADSLYREKMMEQICSDRAIQDYFSLHSPKFDAVEISHILVDSDEKAREIVALLEDDPDSFIELAQEHSLADESRDQGGALGKVLRGALFGEAEAKVFNAGVNEVIGPFPSDDGQLFEIFMVTAKYPASLDDGTRAEVKKLLHREWLQARANEHRIEYL